MGIVINNTTKDGNIVINESSVYVNGKLIKDELSGIIEVHITGEIANVKSNRSVIVNGNVNGDIDAGNSVTCGDVNGDVDAGNSVHCKKVYGDVDAGNKVTRW